MTEEQQARMAAALDGLKILFPNMPVMCVAAFPTDDDHVAMICSGGNIPQHQQVLILKMASDGLTSPDDDDTIH